MMLKRHLINNDRIHDSLWNKSSILIYYIELSTWLNQFEMFVSSLIHERTLKTVLFYNKTVLREKHVKKESNITSSQFIYTDFMNMNLLAVVTPLYIYHGWSTQKNLWEGKFTPANMKNCGRRNVRKHREIKMARSASPWTYLWILVVWKIWK